MTMQYLAARSPSDIEEEASLHGKDLREELRRVGTSKNRRAYQPTSAKGKYFFEWYPSDHVLGSWSWTPSGGENGGVFRVRSQPNFI